MVDRGRLLAGLIAASHRLTLQRSRGGDGARQDSRGAVELDEQAAAAERAGVAVHVELGAAVVDVEVAHRQLADAVERAERRVLDLLHATAARGGR